MKKLMLLLYVFCAVSSWGDNKREIIEQFLNQDENSFLNIDEPVQIGPAIYNFYIQNTEYDEYGTDLVYSIVSNETTNEYASKIYKIEEFKKVLENKDLNYIMHVLKGGALREADEVEYNIIQTYFPYRLQIEQMYVAQSMEYIYLFVFEENKIIAMFEIDAYYKRDNYGTQKVIDSTDLKKIYLISDLENQINKRYKDQILAQIKKIDNEFNDLFMDVKGESYYLLLTVINGQTRTEYKIQLNPGTTDQNRINTFYNRIKSLEIYIEDNEVVISYQLLFQINI